MPSYAFGHPKHACVCQGCAARRPRTDRSRRRHHSIPQTPAGIPVCPPRSKSCQDAAGVLMTMLREATLVVQMPVGSPEPVGPDGLVLCDDSDATTHDAAVGGGGGGDDGPAALLVCRIPVGPVPKCVLRCGRAGETREVQTSMCGGRRGGGELTGKRVRESRGTPVVPAGIGPILPLARFS